MIFPPVSHWGWGGWEGVGWVGGGGGGLDGQSCERHSPSLPEAKLWARPPSGTGAKRRSRLNITIHIHAISQSPCCMIPELTASTHESHLLPWWNGGGCSFEDGWGRRCGLHYYVSTPQKPVLYDSFIGAYGHCERYNGFIVNTSREKVTRRGSERAIVNSSLMSWRGGGDERRYLTVRHL